MKNTGRMITCDGNFSDRTVSSMRQLALGLFTFDARFPRVLHGEYAPRALQRRFQRRRVVEVALHDLHAFTPKRLCPRRHPDGASSRADGNLYRRVR